MDTTQNQQEVEAGVDELQRDASITQDIVISCKWFKRIDVFSATPAALIISPDDRLTLRLDDGQVLFSVPFSEILSLNNKIADLTIRLVTGRIYRLSFNQDIESDSLQLMGALSIAPISSVVLDGTAKTVGMAAGGAATMYSSVERIVDGYQTDRSFTSPIMQYMHNHGVRVVRKSATVTLVLTIVPFLVIPTLTIFYFISVGIQPDTISGAVGLVGSILVALMFPVVYIIWDSRK